MALENQLAVALRPVTISHLEKHSKEIILNDL
jgi:hypothetical protein